MTVLLPVRVDLKRLLEKVIIELKLEVGGRPWVDICGMVCPALLSCDCPPALWPRAESCLVLRWPCPYPYSIALLLKKDPCLKAQKGLSWGKAGKLEAQISEMRVSGHAPCSLIL